MPYVLGNSIDEHAIIYIFTTYKVCVKLLWNQMGWLELSKVQDVLKNKVHNYNHWLKN